MLDYKYEAKKKLEDYEAKCRALVNIPEEIKRLELDFQLIKSATSDGTPVQGGGSRREDAITPGTKTRTYEMKKKLFIEKNQMQIREV